MTTEIGRKIRLLRQSKLLTQEEEMKAQHLLLTELENLMASQQAKLDRIIGVRSELIERLIGERGAK